MRSFILTSIFLLISFSSFAIPEDFRWDHVSPTEIKLIWGGTWNVIIIKGKSPESPIPDNSLDYNVGDLIGTGEIIYKGNGNEIVDSGLSYSNEYYYHLWVIQSWDVNNKYAGPASLTVDFQEDYVRKPYDVTLKVTGNDVKITWKIAEDQEVILLRAFSNRYIEIEQGTSYITGSSIDDIPWENPNKIVYQGDDNEFTDYVEMPEHLYYYLWARPKGSYEYSKYAFIDSITINDNIPFDIEITPLSPYEIKLTWDVLDDYPVTIGLYGFETWFSPGLQKDRYKVGDRLWADDINGSIIYVGKDKEFVYSGLHASTGYYFDIWSSPDEYPCYSPVHHEGVKTKPVEFEKSFYGDFSPETIKIWGARYISELFIFESSENADPELRNYARINDIDYWYYLGKLPPSELISPTIICDGYDIVNMTFNHSILKDENAFTFDVNYSLDEGETWNTLESWTDENEGFENQTPSYNIPTDGAEKIIFKWYSKTLPIPTDWRIYSVDIDCHNFPKADFSPDISSGCAPLTVQFTNLTENGDPDKYQWNFNNQASSTEENPSYTFNQPGLYTVSLKATNVYGEDTEVKTGIIEVLPVSQADFSFDVSSGVAPLTVQFTNLSENSETYQWDFGDGSSSEEHPSHTFNKSGIYSISLEASNGCSTDTEVKNNIIEVFPATKADFSFDVSSGCVPLTVKFTNLSEDGDPDKYQWNFNNQAFSSEEHPSYTFNEPGLYTVSLEATNDYGTDTEVKNNIIEVFPAPLADFQINPDYLILPDDPMLFTTNLSTGADSYVWDFGDGTKSEDTEPGHRYNDPGFYDISLLAVSDEGCKDTIVYEDIVEVVYGNNIQIPNAFTPSLDGPGDGYLSGGGVNDVFYPVTEGVTSYKMQIYNRWGEQLFSTEDSQKGWDGYYKGKLCPSDVYVYKMDFRFIDGHEETKFGDVLLIR